LRLPLGDSSFRLKVCDGVLMTVVMFRFGVVDCGCAECLDAFVEQGRQTARFVY